MNCADRKELVGPLLFVRARMLILISNKRIVHFSFKVAQDIWLGSVEGENNYGLYGE